MKGCPGECRNKYRKCISSCSTSLMDKGHCAATCFGEMFGCFRGRCRVGLDDVNSNVPADIVMW
ncbi:hypothetical protein CRM22_005788 [Opisthorchis felineus]|uniref:Uncharacterized protein n=1 Tax=Opisthorchis felineus TaxID=147828 RepID=A0A4S2LQZ9_OPIFE|nr:hypothetical protein CRM22_005788 [Opisthorchis felineus]